jgi:hypothetical protein
MHEESIVNQALLVRQYLLGELSEENAQRVEEDYLVSDDRFAELLAAEDALIEEFLDRELRGAERARFESRFLSTPRGRQKVALAAALSGASRKPARTPWYRPLAAAAAVILLGIIAAGTWQVEVLRSQVDALQRERKALQESLVRSRAELQRSQAALPTPAFSIILGGADIVRGAERGSTASMVVPAGVPIVDAWLMLPSSAEPAGYAAGLRTVEGRTLWRARGLPARQVDGRRAIVASIPSAVLHPGMYVITVSRQISANKSESIEDFPFTVRRP